MHGQQNVKINLSNLIATCLVISEQR